MKKEATKKQSKQNSKPKSNIAKNKKKSTASRILSKAMPYVLTILFVVLLFSLFGFLGGFGTVVKNLLSGIFSNFASYFIPIFLIYHAIVWYYDTKRKICTRRIICSVITVVLLSSLQHVITVTNNPDLSGLKLSQLYGYGVQGVGGGFIGGLFGKLLMSFGSIIAIISICLVLAFMFLQMFNITPASMMRGAREKRKQKKLENKRVAEENKRKSKIKRRKIDIFDDDDDIDEGNIDILEQTYDDIENKKHKEKAYKNATNEIYKSASASNSSQLKPYDKNKNYKKKAEDYSDSGEELVVTTTKLGEENEDDVPTMELGVVNHNEEETSFEPYCDTEEYVEEAEIPFEETDDIDVAIDSYETDMVVEKEKYGNSEANEVSDDTLTNHVSKEVSQKLGLEETLDKKEELQVEKKSFLQKIKEKKEAEKPTVEANEEKAVVKKTKKKYLLPPIDFLKSGKNDEDEDAVREELQENARKIVTTLSEFGVRTKIVDIARGPTVTRYELAPEAGVRVKAIASLADDIALNLAAEGIRLECPIPGKSAVGIEVPNKITSIVYLRDLIVSDGFKKAKGILTCAVGKSISGDDVFMDIEKTPHLLIAGATGMGKSVCINSVLISLLYKATPEDLRLILIDPKRVELSNYNGIPHLLVPVVCEAKKALGTLQWAVTEMENRFETIEAAGVRNLTEFNEKVDKGYEAEKMSRIVIVIDELADLKMAVPDIEGHITRLTQKARAAGIHIIIGTQRPSVDVITGLIKNNIPSRIAFRVPSLVDSRTILDEQGAEKLVSRGDMLVKIVGALKPVRVQGALVTAPEIQDVIDFLKENSTENYDESVMQQIDSNAAKLAKAEKKESGDSDGDEDELDSEFYPALKIAVEEGRISSSLLQRKLKLGFQRAARIIDQLEENHYIGEQNGSKPRDVLITMDDYYEIMMKRNNEE